MVAKSWLTDLSLNSVRASHNEIWALRDVLKESSGNGRNRAMPGYLRKEVWEPYKKMMKEGGKPPPPFV